MLGSGSLWPQYKLTQTWNAGQLNNQRKPNDTNILADSDLVGRTRSGDNKAFESLVRRYQKLVYNVIFQMVRSHESASDLTQDTFLKAYKALPSFDTTRSFKPWLLKIATNTTLNQLRDRKGQESLEELLEQNPQAEPASPEDVEREVEWRVSQHMLFEALGKLPLPQRKVFVLRYQHDLPYEDIAEISDLSVSSVKSLLFRARENLRKILSEPLAVPK
jgi:RNA polymerase sigma-70 factor (ECF subfamily)